MLQHLSISHFAFPLKYIPLYRYNATDLRPLFQELPQGGINRGFTGIDIAWNRDAYNKVLSDYNGYRFTPQPALEALFDSFLSGAIKDGINIVLAYFPCYTGARELVVNENEMFDCYQKHADKYDITVLNYLDHPMCGDTSFFYDGIHLNSRGASVFSDILANDILRLELLGDERQVEETDDQKGKEQ